MKIRFPTDNAFVRNVAVVMRGAACAQIIMVLTAPVLTRLYSPVDFGVFQTFTSILSFGLVIAAMRYDLAIPLPKDGKHAAQVLLLSFVILTSLTGIILAGVGVEEFLGDGRIINSLPRYFLPCAGLSFFLAGSFQILNYWALREKDFASFSNGRIAQVVGQTAAALIGGVAMPGALSLLLADAVGRLSGFLLLGKKFFREISTHLSFTRRNHMRDVAGRYKAFPTVSLPGALINSAGLTLTPLLLFYFFGLIPAGLFALTERVLGAPSSLIAGSASQVYLSDASSLRREDPERLRSLFWGIIKGQLKLGIIPFFLIFVTGPWIFGSVFGSEWVEAGVYARMLVPVHFIGFVAGPVNLTLIVLEKQMWQLIWDCGRMLVVVSCWVGAKLLDLSPREALFVYGIGMGLCYFCHILLCRRALSTMSDAMVLKPELSAQD